MGTHTMRAITFTALAGLLVSLQAGATEVVTIPLGPDPRVREHIESLEGSERSVTVAVFRIDRSDSKQVQVSVQGPILDDDVRRVVQSVLALDDGFWRGEGSWTVSLIGDASYASVSVAMYCGTLCGGGATDVYAYKEGQWIHLFTAQEWIP